MMRTTLICILCTYIAAYTQPHTLNTLENIKSFTHAVPEAPAADGRDWYNPSFYSFFHEQHPTIIEQIAHAIGMWYPTWDAREFHNILQRVTSRRRNITFTRDSQGEPFQDISVPQGARCIVWGDLHGALHSLYRGLHELHTQGIIDNDLRITDDDTHIVFLGDAIDRSPYCLETLTIILYLMERNPDRITYIRGNHETESYWTNFTTREELKWKASHLSDEPIPLQSELDALFTTLPRVVYMYVAGDDSKAIHMSYNGRNIQGFDFDSADVSRIQRIASSLRGEARFDVMQKAQGLELLGFHYGSTEWSLLACPVWVYQNFFDFMYDAFSIIRFGSNLDASTISLYNRHINSNDIRFSAIATYDVTSGQRLDDTKQAGTWDEFSSLRIGSSLAISRGLSMQGQSIERGMTAAVNYANNTGGISGYMLRPFIFDDGYMPYRALQNAIHLIDDFNVQTFVAPTGTPTVQAYAPRVKNNNGAILFPVTGAPQLRRQDQTHMVHFRPSYPDEARTLTQHIIDEYRTYKMAFFYQDDDFGRPLRDAAIETLKANGITDWLAVPYLLGQVDFEQQAQEIRAYNPSTIGFFSTVNTSKELIRSLNSSFLIGKSLFGNSDLGEYSFRKFITDQGIRFIIARAVPNPSTSTRAIAENFRRRMDLAGWPYDVFAFEGYIAIQLLVEALRNMKGGISVDNMLSWFEGLRNYPFQGLTLTFNPEKRDLSQDVYVHTITDDAN